MAATYDDTLPTDKDVVRFRLGDTNVDPAAAALYSDEAIAAALERNGDNLDLTVSELASGLLAKYAQMPTRWTTPGQSFDFSQRLKAWQGLVIAPAPADAGSSAFSFIPATYSDYTSSEDEYSR